MKVEEANRLLKIQTIISSLPCNSHTYLLWKSYQIPRKYNAAEYCLSSPTWVRALHKQEHKICETRSITRNPSLDSCPQATHCGAL